MPVTLLRWKSGAGGDTVLKILLDSDPDLQSQNRYLADVQDRTLIDLPYVKSFEYDQIAKMSLADAHKVDRELLMTQLNQLDCADFDQRWLLKTHCYFDFPYMTVDIVVDPEDTAFVVKASLSKNSRLINRIPNYDPLISKIRDPKILYKFDCYNFACDLLQDQPTETKSINFKNIVGGWNIFSQALRATGFAVSDSCQDYYNKWLKNNTKYFAGKEFLSLVKNKKYNYQNCNLSIEERYCLLAMAEEKFQILI